MKKYLIILAGALVLSSCSKEQNSIEENAMNISDLSQVVVEYVAENFPDATIESALRVSNSEATHFVILNTTEEIAFNQNGQCIGDAEDFRSTFKGRRGHGGPGNHGGGPGHGGGIPIDSLPAVIKTYVDSNYIGSKIMFARFDTTCQYGNVISVMVGNRRLRTPPTKLVFSLTGTFLFSGNRFAYKNTPTAVKSYISTNYAGFRVRQVAEKLTLSNATIEFNVFVADSVSRKLITIKDDGTFICVR